MQRATIFMCRGWSTLRHWAQPLQLPKGKITYHLLEARNVANGVLDFARSNKVDHLIIGAPTRGGSGGKVSAKITAEAPCTVTVVRAAREIEVGTERSAMPAA